MTLVKEIFNITKGKKASTVFETPNASSARYIQIEDLRNDNNLKYTDVTRLVVAEPSDVIIAWDGAYLGTVGFGLSGVIGSTLARLSIKENLKNNFNGKYLGYFLSSKFSYFQNTATGAAIPHLNKKALESLDVPPLDIIVQNKVVTVLDKTKALIEKRNQTINLLDELLRAKFFDMFGTNNLKSRNWNLVDIETLATTESGSMRTGPFGSSLKHDEFTEVGEVAVLGIDNAVNNEFQWDKKRFITKQRYLQNFIQYTVRPRDVLVTIMGTVGRSAVIPEQIRTAISTKHLACITLDETQCNPYYLAYSIHSDPYIKFQMQSKNRGAIMPGLNLSIIKKLKIKKAPILLQKRFETIYRTIKEKKINLQRSLTDLKKLQNSLLQIAFSGKLALNVSVELDTLLKEIDLQKDKNDLISIVTNEEYLSNLVQRLNVQKFENQELYDKAKHVAFQLLKEQQRLTQEYSSKSKSIKLILK